MKKTRHNVFETNSSSTHSICIAKSNTYDLPESIYFEFGEFGWQEDTLASIEEKASYLYTAAHSYGAPDSVEKIVSILESKGIMVSYEEFKKGSWDRDNGYVDHGSELSEFISDLSNSEDKLLSYLFSDLSFVLTGNDNSDSDVDISVSYDHDEYYKGN